MAPRIFTFLRSPVTGISGGHPTRLKVVWSVESCRKLASSVKMSAQCRERAFFKRGIDAAVPSVLGCGIGARQHTARPLHRKSPAMKQFPYLAGMILNTELLLDHPGNHGRRPDAAVQTVRNRTAV